MNPTTQSLSSDNPENDPANDVLGYAPFAKYLAKSMVQMTPQSGIVLGVYAPWGAGKTTLLNFVQHYLKEYSEVKQPVVVPFNPWWFSGQEDLAFSFFQQLLSVLRKDKRVSAKVRGAIEKYAPFVGQSVGTTLALFAAAHGVPTPPAAAATAITEGLKTLGANKPSINEVKSNVESALRESKTKLLVVIDDIDRLTAEETRQLFRVVKAVADFPNVIYLLAFDRTVAAKALEAVHVGDGNAYLEKIVQVPFELPMPDSTSLQKMLFSRLDVILSTGQDNTRPDELFIPSYWANVYREGIYPFIKTPRDVVRLTNTLSVTYPSVRGEVNPVDFIAVEALRVFVPSVYNVIRSNPEMFSGAEEVKDYNKKQFVDFHTSWLETLDAKSKKPIKDLLLRLLPKTNVAWEVKWSQSDRAEMWRRNRRLAHPDIFPVYFRLAPPTNDLSAADVNRMVNAISDNRAFTKTLLQLQETIRPDRSSLARRFLELFEDYTDDLPEAKIPIVVQGLVDAGDTLLSREEEREHSFLDFGLSMQIGRIIHQLLKRLAEPERFGLLKAVFSQTESYYTVAQRLSLFGQQLGKYGSEASDYEVTINHEHLEELEQIGRLKISEYISPGNFQGSLSLRFILHLWSEISSVGEVTGWLGTVTASDEGLLDVLTNFLSSTKSQAVGDSIVHKTSRLDPFWFKPYFDLSELHQRVEGLANRIALSDKQRLAVLQFLQEFEDRDNGLNPDGFHYKPSRTVFDRFQAAGLNPVGDEDQK